MNELIKEFVEDIVKKLVENTNEVRVNVITSTKSVIAQIKVAKSDIGKIIGKKGRTITAIKILVLAVKNLKHSDDTRRINLEILEDDVEPPKN